MIVVIVGMHRSGTSALAGTLNANGICMGEQGDFHPPPMKENPKGFFENRRFRTINDHLLRACGYRVKSFDPTVPDWNHTPGSSIYGQMDNVVDYYHNKYDHWGWKDPRTCLTLRPWLDTLLSIAPDNIKVLLTMRGVGDIQASMLARGNKEKEPGQFLALASAYYHAALNALQDARVGFYEVPFTSLINDTAVCMAGISKYLGMDLPNITFIEKNVSRTPATAHPEHAAGGGI